MSVTKEILDELEVKHKRIAHLKGKSDDGAPPWEIVIRKPSRAEYKQYRAQSHNQATVADAQEILVRKIAVYPTGDALEALLDDWPAIPEACGKALGALTGLSAAEDVK